MESLDLPKKIGHYTLICLLGKGGMGEVFLATDEILQRQVAIKLLPLHKDDPERRARFVSEARAIAALNHPNIVIVHEVGEAKEDQEEGEISIPYLVMEYIEGESLERLLSAQRLSPYDTISFAVQMVEGLQAAHQRRIIHRDIKPSNLMVTSAGRIKILDFGLSKLIYDSSPEASTQIKQTREGAILGTIDYLSPEQALGWKLDARSDIFSFGIVLYQMLTGRHPFPSANAIETIAKIVTQEPEPWPESLNVPNIFEKIIEKCLKKDPAERYASAAELLLDLEIAHRELQSVHEAGEPSPLAVKQRSNISIATLPAKVTEEVKPTTLQEGTLEEPDSRRVEPLAEMVIEEPMPALVMKGPKPLLSVSKLLIAIISSVVIASVVFVFWKNRAGRATEIMGALNTVQITASPGLDIYPTFSPDGRSIAYSSDRSGKFEVYIKQLTPGGREIQLTSDGEENFQPAWSPDGERIAYYSKNRGGIWVMPALGGEAKQLTEFGSKPAWSPDGAFIAFQSDALTDLAANAFAAIAPSTIWTVSLQGGEPLQITKVGNPPGGHGTPSWSPDGRRIAFATYDNGTSEIWSVSAKGDELVRVVYTQHYWLNYDPIYSPDGENIYYCALSESWNYGMWKVPISPGSGEPKGEPAQIANLGLGTIKQPAISADGKRIAYSVQSMTSNLWALPVSPTTGVAAGKLLPLTTETGRNSRPAFSPDGTKIAFNKWRPGTNQDVWIIDADGGNPTQLTTNPAVDFMPSWFPEGDRVAFLSNRGERSGLWSILLKNRRETLLTNVDQDIDQALLSPDGKQFAFNSKKGSGTINTWVVAVEGGQPRQITSDNELMGFPCWSPDGKFLALQMKRGENTHVVITPSSGGEPTQLTSDPGQSWPYSWSPDGDKIAFAGFRNGFWNIWWVSRATKDQKQITNYTKLNAYVRYPAWSPKGDRIVYEYAETTGNIWMIENLK